MTRVPKKKTLGIILSGVIFAVGLFLSSITPYCIFCEGATLLTAIGYILRIITGVSGFFFLVALGVSFGIYFFTDNSDD